MTKSVTTRTRRCRVTMVYSPVQGGLTINNELKLTMALMQGAKALPVPVPHKSKGLVPGFDYNRRDHLRTHTGGIPKCYKRESTGLAFNLRLALGVR